jgi:hypothetical protein
MTDIAKKPTTAKKKLPAPGRKQSTRQAIEETVKQFPKTLSKLAK